MLSIHQIKLAKIFVDNNNNKNDEDDDDENDHHRHHHHYQVCVCMHTMYRMRMCVCIRIIAIRFLCATDSVEPLCCVRVCVCLSSCIVRAGLSRWLVNFGCLLFMRQVKRNF